MGPARHEIIYQPPAALRPFARNARTHSRKQVRQIADSIERFGFTNPVLVSDAGEIIAGHGRVSTYAAAAKRARSNERKAEHLAELHDYQRQFDQINDLIAPRYRIELQDRSYHPDASRSGEYAKKLGIKLSGPPLPQRFPAELLKLLEE